VAAIRAACCVNLAARHPIRHASQPDILSVQHVPYPVDGISIQHVVITRVGW
jgi:hypothetical protein